jgi:hypothetical protein
MASARFFERPTDGLVGDLLDFAEFDQLVSQKTERPAAPACGRTSTRQGDQVGLLLAVKHSRPARQRPTNEGVLPQLNLEEAAVWVSMT